MFYIYSDYAGDGVEAETYEEAVKIAKEYAIHSIEGDSDESVEIQIYKLYETLSADTTINYTVSKAKED